MEVILLMINKVNIIYMKQNMTKNQKHLLDGDIKIIIFMEIGMNTLINID